jgi:hypothetical protein
MQMRVFHRIMPSYIFVFSARVNYYNKISLF